MHKIDPKFEQEFKKLMSDWEALRKNPSSSTLSMVMKDIQQLQQNLRNIRF